MDDQITELHIRRVHNGFTVAAGASYVSMMFVYETPSGDDLTLRDVASMASRDMRAELDRRKAQHEAAVAAERARRPAGEAPGAPAI